MSLPVSRYPSPPRKLLLIQKSARRPMPLYGYRSRWPPSTTRIPQHTFERQSPKLLQQQNRENISVTVSLEIGVEHVHLDLIFYVSSNTLSMQIMHPSMIRTAGEPQRPPVPTFGVFLHITESSNSHVHLKGLNPSKQTNLEALVTPRALSLDLSSCSNRWIAKASVPVRECGQFATTQYLYNSFRRK